MLNVFEYRQVQQPVNLFMLNVFEYRQVQQPVNLFMLQAERQKTKGKGWFGLPATELDDEKKNDLLALQMRRALDPKRFYKNNDLKGLPKYYQVS